MKIVYKFGLIAFCFAIVLTSCSRKKDNFISRTWHSVGTKYNILYNGNVALDVGKKALNDSYQDNYYDILPIERMQVSEEIVLEGTSENENFARAEEKAVKAVQKHSMNIQGKEHNPQIDEAYLLLGKARYFDQRFIPALDAFNKILRSYAASDKINQAKIWKEKTNIRLDNNELAIKNLKRLLKQEELNDQDLADATSMLAQGYINTNVLDSAVAQIEIAANVTKSNDERGRYRFIQGQLYNRLGHADSANIAFDKIIALHRKIPRIYFISAHIEKAKNFDYKNGNRAEFYETLTKLEKNRENRPYLDKIYNQIANYHLNNESSDSLAIVYFNKSLKKSSGDKALNARNYEALGNINFDAANFENAGAYYDSTMTSLGLNSKPYRLIKRKRDNLNDVINYEIIAQVNDSILNLVNLSKPEREQFFNNYVEELKRKDEAERERQENAINYGLKTVNNQFNQNNSDLKSGPTSKSKSIFYFYNPTTVAYGKNEFAKIWGNRKLEDDWRFSDKAFFANEEITTQNSDDLLVTDEERYNPEFYISKIPTDQKAIDDIVKERNFAYYQLGVIYKEKFKEYQLAKTKLQSVLNFNPEEKLVLPSKYHLYKIYELLGESSEAAIAKNKIISNYPNTRYASILANPELAVEDDKNSADNLYEALYKSYEEQDYANVISQADSYITRFEGEDIVPKMELLKATAIGRLKGFEAYSKAINFVALTYPNSDEGKQAQNLAQNTLPKLAKTAFENADKAKNFKAVFTFVNASASETENFRKALSEAIQKIVLYKLSESKDTYNENTTFVVVHGFKSMEGAKGFAGLLQTEDANKITKDYFAISSNNYKTIQINKNLEAYLASQ